MRKVSRYDSDTTRIAYRPYWWDIDESLQQVHDDPLPKSSDVVIVGGGYTGMAAALVFARAGKSVSIIEKSTPDMVHRPETGALILPASGPVMVSWKNYGGKILLMTFIQKQAPRGLI